MISNAAQGHTQETVNASTTVWRNAMLDKATPFRAALSERMNVLDRLALAIKPLVTTRPVHFIALLGLCAAYIQGGLAKLLDFSAAVVEAQHFGLPFSSAIATATIV